MNINQTIRKQLNPQSDPPRLGVDEWVAQVDQRQQPRHNLWGFIAAAWAAIPLWGRVGLIGLILAALPFITATPLALDLLGLSGNDFIVRVGATCLAFSILAVGLNVVVGYAGLLDLGYVAFFGLAGYAYAYLSSDFVGEGIHLPSLISLPLVIGLTALIGWLLGALTLRLHGDYLAIITLGFGLLFVQLASTLTRVNLFWLEQPVDLTRGPNGINGLDDIALFGYSFHSTTDYYFLFLLLLALILMLVHHLNQSRVGRAWRAMREDELAAEAMGMPTRRLKLLAFAVGAAIAALVGAVFAAWQGSVSPSRYDLLTLIDLYGMVVLGGIGSLPGVILGAFIFTILPELLRNVALATILFYGGGLLGLISWLRSPRRVVAVLGSVLVVGLGLKLLVNLLWPGFDAGLDPTAGFWLNQWAQQWLVIPANFKIAGNIAIGLSLVTLLGTVWGRQPWRWLWLGLTLYLLVFGWETRLAVEPAITRILTLGATLIILMIVRPQGLLGKLHVRIV